MQYQTRLDEYRADPEGYVRRWDARAEAMLQRDMERRAKRLRRLLWRARACGALTGLRIGMGLKSEHKHRSWCPNA